MNHVWLLLMIIPCAHMKIETIGYYPVSACPKDAEEWEASSQRLKCNKTHNYHCAPYHNRSKLYEFCYKMAVLKVRKGHCLGIAESGILNFDSCHIFSQGCPNEDYYSNEIYKYPSCLSIQGNCFTEDCVCNCLTAATKSYYGKCVYEDGEKSQNQYFIPFVTCCIISVLSIVINVLQFIRSQVLEKGAPCPEKKPLLKKREQSTSMRREHAYSTDYFHPIYAKTLVGFTVEDAELFKQLKQRCLGGALQGFEYLVRSRVIPKDKQYIFRQCDANGCILLHFAAQGGCHLIIEEILKHVSIDILVQKSIRGQNALHFAMRYKQRNMTEYLIKKYSNLKNAQIEENSETCMKEFAPVFWVAWYGDEHLLHSLKQAKFDITTKAGNGLNMLDIACMSEELEGQINFCKHLLENESDKIDPEKVDLSGWNIAHYASMCNFELLQYILSSDKLCGLATKKTKSLKTCLHIASQSAKFEIVKLIVRNQKPFDIEDKDELGWNALHFAAKGGNLEILEYLLEKGLMYDSLTMDDKTILHIACREKQVDICRYAVNKFPKDLLNAKTTRGMTAAHYLGVQNEDMKKESVETILDLLCNSNMDLTTMSYQGYTMLIRAIDHSNIELIKCIVGNQKLRTKCGIYALSSGIEQTNNTEIKEILHKALDEMKNEME